MALTIKHIGTKYHSGRYPWGSGGDDDTISGTASRLAEEGFTDAEIAAAMGFKSTKELRDQKAIESAALKEQTRLDAVRRREAGMSIGAIAKEMNLPKSTVADLLKSQNLKFRIIQTISNVLKTLVARDKYIDIGKGAEIFVGVSRTKLDNAVALLQNEGYTVHYIYQEQLTNPGKYINLKVLAAPGVTKQEIYDNKAQITPPNFVFDTANDSVFLPDSPKNMSSSRVLVRYANEGGADKDGLIELRRGVPEFSLGDASYAQVRIGVDGTHYMKGMAVYRDDLPKGVDVVYYSNKQPTGNKLDALKSQKEVGASRFGAVVKPNMFVDSDGKTKQGYLNIVGDETLNIEGAWSGWSKTLSSQMVSKQSPAFAKRQLDILSENAKAEFNEIMSLTNPTVKQHLLIDFANRMDSDAVELQAAAMPRSGWHVLLPDPKIKPNQIYAPNYNDGEQVILIRYPHGGVFEIPELQVNNKTSEYRGIIGPQAKDAVAVHPSVAQKLSGADFDGDTVIVIPDRRKEIRTEPSLEGLKNFDPKAAYPAVPGMKVLTEKRKQAKMGEVSNLITDMTIKGAPPSEIARAVRHSMVIIDAAKEDRPLNWKQSEIDNGIVALKRKYQGGGGASTIISKSKSPQYVDARMDRYNINPVTGEKEYIYTKRERIDKRTGEVLPPKKMRSYKMAEVRDAYELAGKNITPIERVYADHANRMKGLANQARLESLKQTPVKYSPDAFKTYREEVASLDAKYKAAVSNKPIERKAQLVAQEIYNKKLDANPNMSEKDRQKAKARSLSLARARLGKEKTTIDITPREWQAMEMGAVSKTRFQDIMRVSDMHQIREYATPKAAKPRLSTGKQSRAKALLDSGYTTAEVARALGVPEYRIRNLDD